MRRFKCDTSQQLSKLYIQRNSSTVCELNFVGQMAVQNNQINCFEQFNILDLLSTQPSLRYNAERIKHNNIQYPKQYISYVTKVVMESINPFEVQLAFSLLREIITQINLTIPNLLDILSLYSDLYLKSCPTAIFMSSFRLFLVTLFTKIDSLDVNIKRQTYNKPATLQCYYLMESKFMQGCLLALSFMCLYIKHLYNNRINLSYFKKMPFKKQFRKFVEIQCKNQDPWQRQKFVQLKGKFILILFKMCGTFRTKVFSNYIAFIPKQVYSYTTDLLVGNKLNVLQINALICYLFSHILKKDIGGQIDIDLLIAISECCSIVLEKYFEKQHPSFHPACIQTVEQIMKEQIGAEFDYQQDKFQQDSISAWSCVSLQPQHYFNLLTWILDSLVKLQSPPEGVIITIIKPLKSIFTSKYKQKSVQVYITDHLFQLLLQKNKHEHLKNYQKYAYFSYYILGYYFPCQYYQIQLKLVEEAIINLKNNRFKNTNNNISLLMYLHKFIFNSWEYNQIVIQQIRCQVINKMSSFNIDQISLVFLICLDRKHISQESENINDQMTGQFRQKLWPSLAVCGSQNKVAILESLRHHFDRDKIVSGCFFQELLCMISQNQQEVLAVRIEYLRLIANCLAYVESIEYILDELLQFLKCINQRRLVQELEIQGLLNLLFNLIKQCNLSNKQYFSVQMILFCGQTVNKYPNHILAYNQLLIELFSISTEQKNSNQSSICQEQSTLESNEQQVGLNDMIIVLHSRIVEFILSCPSFPTDTLCDTLQIYIMYNPTRAKFQEDNILRACYNNYNYYRMVYLLRPLPYPTRIFQKFPQELHHLKWNALYLMGKFFRSNFCFFRQKKKEQEILTQQFSKLACGVGKQDYERLSTIRQLLQFYQRESSQSWIRSLENCSPFEQLSTLYQQQYTTKQILQRIDQLLQSN